MASVVLPAAVKLGYSTDRANQALVELLRKGPEAHSIALAIKWAGAARDAAAALVAKLEDVQAARISEAIVVPKLVVDMVKGRSDEEARKCALQSAVLQFIVPSVASEENVAVLSVVLHNKRTRMSTALQVDSQFPAPQALLILAFYILCICSAFALTLVT
jgi:hypothetical protein